MSIEITDIVTILLKVKSLEQINDWLDTRHPLLHDMTPTDAVLVGEIHRVRLIARNIAEGAIER